MRKDTLFLILLFVGGLWVAQLIGKEYFLTYGYLNPYHVTAYINESFDFVDLFWNVLWIRGKQFLLIVLFRMTPFKKILPIAIKVVLTFMFGFLLMACTITVGGAGILVFFATIFPHGICYMAGIICLFRLEEKYCINTGKRMRDIAVKAGCCFLLVVSGCILETVIGTRILRWALGIGNG